ncbi:108R [Invertebrate iridescent virus Kaz2018]|nr:108R [Invertebrate iridescent virus Kaz2018]
MFLTNTIPFSLGDFIILLQEKHLMGSILLFLKIFEIYDIKFPILFYKFKNNININK